MQSRKKWSAGRIILLILGILLAGLVAAAAIAFPYYDGFQKPARSYEALAREMEKLEDVYLPDKPPEDATDVSYTYQLENRFLWSKPTGYLIRLSESVDGIEIEMSISCNTLKPGQGAMRCDFLENGVEIAYYPYEETGGGTWYVVQYRFNIGTKTYQISGYVDAAQAAAEEKSADLLENRTREYVDQILWRYGE